jgi:ABC-2 type transport system permease protein
MNNAPPRARVNQPLLFQRLRLRLFRNTLRVVLSRSPVRVLTILLCSVLIWGTLFAGSYEGFRFMQEGVHLPLDGDIALLLFDVLFLVLTVLLLFSGCIILYSSLFGSAETAFLLSTPASDDQVFAYKFQGAVAFSSWAFVLLGTPFLIAYGLVIGAPDTFYGLLLLFFLGFVLVPGSLGALACLLVVNFIPKRHKQVLWAVGLAGLAVLVAWGYRVVLSTQAETTTRDALYQLLGQFSLVRGPLTPNHWVAQGVQAAALGEWGKVAYYLGLVWSNGLFLYVLTAWAARRLYRRGYNRFATGGTLRRRYGGGWLDRGLGRLLGWLDPQTRLLIIKDFRTFRRDPAQWAQILIFLGLLTFYFSIVRRFYSEDIGRQFLNGISLLNLAATGMLLCAYTGRFIYPLLSLEGRKFWILGLLPLRRERLLWGKFAFSATGALLIAEFLMLLSDILLTVSWLIVVVHVLTVAVLAVGLSGLSVGLGAWMPNFKETDPSKIAVGFGGTLNLVAGLLFLVTEIALMAGPFHLQILLSGNTELTLASLQWWQLAGAAAGLAVGAVAVLVPLRMGARTLRGMEF